MTFYELKTNEMKLEDMLMAGTRNPINPGILRTRNRRTFRNAYDDLDEELIVRFMSAGDLTEEKKEGKEPTKKVVLLEKIREAKEDQPLLCDICYEDIKTVYMQFPCCSTTESYKNVHAKCAVNCLRTKNICPFCKSATISFE